MKQFLITKMSGKKELFNEAKVRKSLSHSGLDTAHQTQLIEAIYKKKPVSTLALHNYILHFLRKHEPAVAARYNLKRAIVELGPAGFPFEQFIALIFETMGFTTEKNVTMQGACITHEVDVCAHKGATHYIIECKFHSRLGLASDVKVPLYVKARFDDITSSVEKQEPNPNTHTLLVATNTRFTSQATDYANCIGISLLSWNYPYHASLPMLMDLYDINPITCLTNLKKYQKRSLIAQGIVTCKQLLQQKINLKAIGLSTEQSSAILTQAKKICTLGKKIIRK